MHISGRRADRHGSPGHWRTFLSSQRGWRDDGGSWRGERARARRWPGALPAWPPSEVLLPPLLGLNGIQDGLPLRLVLLPDLFNLLLHHGVQGQEPLLKVLYCPTLQLQGR